MNNAISRDTLNRAIEENALNTMHAVITGDVIESRKSGPSRWLPALKDVLAGFGHCPRDWDIFRGDAFQLYIENASDAFEVVMKVKAGFKSHKGLDVRMAIGIGDVSFRSETIGESSGSAFIRSGALVDKLTQLNTTLAMASPWPDFDTQLNASLAMAAAVMDKWLPNYAQAISAYLAEPQSPQRVQAERLGIAQNTLSERQTRAHRRELVQFEPVFRRLIERQLTG